MKTLQLTTGGVPAFFPDMLIHLNGGSVINNSALATIFPEATYLVPEASVAIAGLNYSIASGYMAVNGEVLPYDATSGMLPTPSPAGLALGWVRVQSIVSLAYANGITNPTYITTKMQLGVYDDSNPPPTGFIQHDLVQNLSKWASSIASGPDLLNTAYSGWNAIILSTGWSSDLVLSPVQYRVADFGSTGKKIEFTGGLKLTGLTYTDKMFTLPLGLRPAKSVFITGNASGDAGYFPLSIKVAADGNVSVADIEYPLGTGTKVWLEGISFWAL